MPGNFLTEDTVVGLRFEQSVAILELKSNDGTNKLQLGAIESLARTLADLRAHVMTREIAGLVFTGNHKFFSAGADLNEIAALSAPAAFEFSRAGQRLMSMVDQFPVPVIAAVRGYCMGGGLDLALACDFRVVAPNALFGHRGATLGLMTGWGGTQRLPRLVGKSPALQMFLTAAMVSAEEALEMGLVDEITNNPITSAVDIIRGSAESR